MEIAKDFGVQLSLLVAQIINFLILLFVLNKLLYKPILKMLAERRKRIEESMKNAADLETRLARLEEEQTAILKRASGEADKLIAESKESGKHLADDMVKEARVQAEKIAERAQQQAMAEMEKMRSELRGEIAAVAAITAQKVVAEVLTKEQREQLTKKAAQEIAS